MASLEAAGLARIYLGLTLLLLVPNLVPQLLLDALLASEVFRYFCLNLDGSDVVSNYFLLLGLVDAQGLLGSWEISESSTVRGVPY